MTHQLLPITYDNIEAIAAAGFAKSRDCITAIRMDVLHNIQPLERVGFERLIKLIEARQIFKPEILEELDVQMDFLTREIDKGTTVHQHRDYDECNVSAPACWQEARTTVRADELGRAMIMFFELLRDPAGRARPDARTGGTGRAASDALTPQETRGLRHPASGALATLLLLQMSARRPYRDARTDPLCAGVNDQP